MQNRFIDITHEIKILVNLDGEVGSISSSIRARMALRSRELV